MLEKFWRKFQTKMFEKLNLYRETLKNKKFLENFSKFFTDFLSLYEKS